MTVDELIGDLTQLSAQGFGANPVYDLRDAPVVDTAWQDGAGGTRVLIWTADGYPEDKDEHPARQAPAGLTLKIVPPLDDDGLAQAYASDEFLFGFDPSSESGSLYLSGIVDLATHLGASVTGVTADYQVEPDITRGRT